MWTSGISNEVQNHHVRIWHSTQAAHVSCELQAYLFELDAQHMLA